MYEYNIIINNRIHLIRSRNASLLRYTGAETNTSKDTHVINIINRYDIHPFTNLICILATFTPH